MDAVQKYWYDFYKNLGGSKVNPDGSILVSIGSKEKYRMAFPDSPPPKSKGLSITIKMVPVIRGGEVVDYRIIKESYYGGKPLDKEE